MITNEVTEEMNSGFTLIHYVLNHTTLTSKLGGHRLKVVSVILIQLIAPHGPLVVHSKQNKFPVLVHSPASVNGKQT